MTAVVPTPDITLQKRVLSIQETVASLKIVSPQQYVHAAEVSKSISALCKEISSTFDPIISKAYAAHKEACNAKARFLNPLQEQQRKVDSLILNWNREQERLRRQQEEELASQVRRDQEAQAMREAEELERQGEPELANVVLENQIAAPAPVVSIASAVPKVQGLGKRTAWQFRIKDAALVPREYCEPAMTKIGGVVRALKGATRIAGVEVFEVDIPIHR